MLRLLAFKMSGIPPYVISSPLNQGPLRKGAIDDAHPPFLRSGRNVERNRHDGEQAAGGHRLDRPDDTDARRDRPRPTHDRAARADPGGTLRDRDIEPAPNRQGGAL